MDIKVIFLNQFSPQKFIPFIFRHLKLPLYTCPICQMDFYAISYANPLTHLRKRHGQENATASDLIDHRPKHMTTITSQKLFHQHFGASKVKGSVSFISPNVV